MIKTKLLGEGTRCLLTKQTHRQTNCTDGGFWYGNVLIPGPKGPNQILFLIAISVNNPNWIEIKCIDVRQKTRLEVIKELEEFVCGDRGRLRSPVKTHRMSVLYQSDLSH